MILDEKHANDKPLMETIAPDSRDVKFDFDFVDKELLNEIKNFAYLDCFKANLKRRSFLGIKKKEDEIISYSTKPFSKGLVMLPEQHEDKLAERNFQVILNIMTENKQEKILNMMNDLIGIS